MANTLTSKQRRFIKEYVVTEGNATEAAIRAGYSTKSARNMGYRLLKDPDIQSELAQHFVDEEKEVSEALKSSLIRMRDIIEDPDSDRKDFFKASKLLLEYTKLATGVLGLNVKPGKEVAHALPAATLEELRDQHRSELARLEQLISGRAANRSANSGESPIQ